MYKTVIFDLDGTLIDSSEGIIRAVSEALKNLDYPMLDEGLIRSLIGPPIGNEIVKELNYGKEKLQEFNTEFRYLYKTKYLMEAKIYPGIEDLLSHLSDSRFMAVATNKRMDYTLTLMDNLDLSKYFDVIEGSDLEGKLGKTELVGRCMKSSGNLPSETVVIGDTVYDALAAKTKGADFIGVTYGFGFRNPGDVSYGRAATSVSSLEDVLL